MGPLLELVISSGFRILLQMMPGPSGCNDEEVATIDIS